MSIDIAAVLRHAGALWRRDRTVLAPLSGLFLFVPQWALLLLVPEAPRIGADPDQAAAMAAWSDALEQWLTAHGSSYLLAMLLGQYATLAILAVYLTRPQPETGAALLKALRLLLRFILAGLLVALPLGVIVLLAMPRPAGLLLAMAPVFYVLGRSCLTGAVICAEAGTGAVAAVKRSWALTRGRGLAVAVLVAGLTGTGQLAAAVIVAVDHVLKLAGMGNPVTLAVVDAGAAAASWASALALALVQVVLYRRLAR